MKKRDPPLVETWSCPMKCKLTREGELLAQDLHWNAHERQMCSCSFVRGFNEGGGENNNNDNDDDKGNGASTSGVARRGVAAGLAKPKPSLMANLDDEVEVEVEDDDVVVGTQCSQLAMMSQKPVGVFPSSGEMQQPPSQQVLPQILENNTQQTEGSGAAEEEEDPYESHLRTSSDLSLPPLEENEKFSDAYDVILQMDNREQLRRNADSSGKQGSRAQNLEMYTSALTESGLKVEIGHLAVGDVTWVARRKKMKQTASSSSFATGDRETYVLDYVIERKSVDDLVESMKSNRYGIQKLLLHKSGLSNVLYLVEGDIDAHNNAQMAKNALVKMQVKDGFTVVRTGGINGTLQLYKNLTRLIEKQYSSMTGPTSASSQQCLTLKGLEELASRERKLTISDIFKLQLQHIPGIGKQAAEAIVKVFATPMVFWKGAVVGEDGNPDVKKAVDALKGISLSHGVRKSTLGQIKAKKIMGFLLNSEV
jgi:ERCC4-type nuclease